MSLTNSNSAQNWLSLAAPMTWPQQMASLALGVLFIAASAQLAIPLPFTPVPITGQTFAVLLVALLYGRRLGFATVTTYLGAGLLGAPVFALTGGATTGYLIGMALASYVVGLWADRCTVKSWRQICAANLVGTAIIFICGLAVLAAIFPLDRLLSIGLWPFLPGAVIKIALATAIAHRFYRRPQ